MYDLNQLIKEYYYSCFNSKADLGGHRGCIVPRLHRGVYHCLSQQAYGAPKGRTDHQDRVGGNLVEEQSGGGGWKLGQDPLFGKSASAYVP